MRLHVALLALILGASTACAAEEVAAPSSAGDDAEITKRTKAPSKRRSLDGYVCPAGASGVKVAFFDADSTLRVSKANAVTATSATDVDILPFAAAKIRALRKDGFLVAIISNQGGVSAGKTTYEVAEGGLALTASQLTSVGARVDYFDFAEADDEHRKPEVGMERELDEALRAKCKVGVDIAHSQMIGDSGYKKDVDGPHPDGRPADDFSNADRLFAENLKIPFQEPTDAFGWRAFGVYNVLGERELVPFLATLDRAAEEAASSGDKDRAKALRAEVAENRKLNGL